MKLLCIASLTSALASAALAARVAVNWDIGYVSVDRDGHSLRRAVGVNGALPIAPIEATIGDTVELTVRNLLDKPLTMHAHGLFPTNNTHMDGPGMLTQCGIPPGDSFTYVYHLEQTGTFWVHEHLFHGISDGLRAPLIVYDKPNQAPFDYDDDLLLTFEDWFQEEFADREMRTLDPNQKFPPPHGYASGLINGIDGNRTHELHFEPGKTYRLRLLNMGDLNSFQFSLPGHSMHVIEVDGEYTKPHAVDGIDIYPAQRYSVLVRAHDSIQCNYRFNSTIHARFIPAQVGMTPRTYLGDVIYHQGAPFNNATDVYAAPGFKWLEDIELQAFNDAPPLTPNRQISLDIGNQLYSTGQHLDHINNVTFAPPRVPTLFTALSMGALALDARVYGPQTNAIVLRHGEVIELTINSANQMPHPIHIHSRSFQVIEYGPAVSQFPVPADYQNITVRRSGNAPPRRDTVAIPEYSYVKLRFTAGSFITAVHCHFSIHSMIGMFMVFVESPDLLQKSLRVPQSMYDMCHKQGIRTSGNAAGNPGLDFRGLQNTPTVVNQPNRGPPENH
ncbi:ferroxidase fet3 [Coemansia sp. RSA 2706]|nr:ferroxidase fet3 [Coemansia sp. RSA 2706]KAJ2315414.1 ferroxidase fet3 [Coemansia sp. RSA 2705]KAJ2322306.1 ferroxidase fet3 [Coemansia sp. RSA 2704]KAJ2329854.1 ferroxidase fet3 [Coemansia sp. RSA 2702]KAJ2370239.1 ferroxidase fet3 [Coemansia sp. RSA 2610]KAJ2739766.1 ferroxidase fet3 [Coemansia sp. Cherry 401B]